ncbi:Ubiquitin-like protein ATG12 [Aphelenchoides fujianensis]|nr:Ubiquitin-like protein ATG12 [Aphelenchoides fujianensis]
MGVYDLNSKPTKPEELSSFEYWYLQYCLTTGLYMLEPWERKLFNTVAVSTFLFAAMSAEPPAPSKITVLLKAVGNTPILKQKNWNVDPTRTVAWLVSFVKTQLQLGPADSLFVFVNQSFSPSPDHTVGDLHNCYAPGAQKLVIQYSTTNAWG